MRSQRSYPNESLIQFLASRYFDRSIAERKTIRVLEVGCGSGANIWMIAKEGFDAYGIDSSQEGIALAQTHLNGKWGVLATLQVGLFTKLPYTTAYFDAVVDVVSLQHLSLADSSIALAEIIRVLKPNGTFFSFRLSDASVMYQSSGGRWIDTVTVDNIVNPSMPLSNNGPTSFWSPGLTRQIYQEIGFDLPSVERYGRTYEDGTKYVEYLTIIAAKPS